jgi:hypothetical protein
MTTAATPATITMAATMAIIIPVFMESLSVSRMEEVLAGASHPWFVYRIERPLIGPGSSDR